MKVRCVCARCGVSFERQPNVLQGGRGRFCSVPCARWAQYRGTEVERFWANVDRRQPDECWLWKGALSSTGYGMVGFDGKRQKAHRIAYRLAVGAIASSGFICHRCDEPRCVNPAHLFEGSHADNVRDMMEKDRQNRGERNGQAKLTERQVKEIRARKGTETLRTTAARYGVSAPAVHAIQANRAWRGLTVDAAG
jgi:hypothetical protein